SRGMRGGRRRNRPFRSLGRRSRQEFIAERRLQVGNELGKDRGRVRGFGSHGFRFGFWLWLWLNGSSFFCDWNFFRFSGGRSFLDDPRNLLGCNLDGGDIVGGQFLDHRLSFYLDLF